MSRRSTLRAAVCWLPVVLVAAVLSVAPSSNGSGTASLSITPRGTYGGQAVTFSGDMGTGEQVIHMVRAGNPQSNAWGPVIDPRTGRQFTTRTAGDGSFHFKFPSPAMNGVYFRVVSERGVSTNPVQFSINHQDAEVTLLLSSLGNLSQWFTAVGDPFRIRVDTANGGRKPVLVGRQVTLQVREGGVWKNTGRTALVGRDGIAIFDSMTFTTVTNLPLVYRVVLESWTQNGDNVGWFPSLPFFLNIVRG